MTRLHLTVTAVAAISVIAAAALMGRSHQPSRAGAPITSTTASLSPETLAADLAATAPAGTERPVTHVVAPRAPGMAASAVAAPATDPLPTAVDATRAKELDQAVLDTAVADGNAAATSVGFVGHVKELIEGVSGAPIPGADLLSTGTLQCGAKACRMQVPTEALEALRPYFDRNGSSVTVETFDPNDGTALQTVYLLPRG